ARGAVRRLRAPGPGGAALGAGAGGGVGGPRARRAGGAAGRGGRVPATLTRREREIVRHVALGLRNAEVGRELSISEVTVKTHINNIFQKLGIRDRVALALYAVRNGIIGVHERRL